MHRHAYLIMAHSHPEQLLRLVRFLDAPENDIYLHIDRKAAGFDLNALKQSCRHSRVQLLPRKRLAWGGSSLTACEIALLRRAVRGRYDYYHLLSGSDIPLRPLAEISRFFDDHMGEEFIAVNREATASPGIYGRISQYYLLQNLVGRRGTGLNASLWELQLILVNIQKKLGIDRSRHLPLRLGKGSQWFSVTHAFACHVLNTYDRTLRAAFRLSKGSDELLMQTVILNEPSFRPRLSGRGNLRLIDWSRSPDGCSPYTFTAEDYDFMIRSGRLWARKVSPDTDRRIIDMIYQTVSTDC